MNDMVKLEELMMRVDAAGRKRAEADTRLQLLMSTMLLRRGLITRSDIDHAQELKQAADNAYVDALWAYYERLDQMVWSGESG